MKRIIAILLAAAMLAVSFAGCGQSEQKDKKLNIIASIFPEYDWAAQITKNVPGVELTLLLDNGADLHSYQPSADDIYKISVCDLFIYGGGESSRWFSDAVQASDGKIETVNLLETLGKRAKEEEVVEGMQNEEEEEEEGGTEYDEHTWLSVKNAKYFCQAICDKLCSLDSGNSKLYKENTAEYTAQLDLLDKKYEDMVSEAKLDTLLFGDRFPFRYLTDDYKLKYFAAFKGCSAETEASFETIKFLADKLNELKLPAVMTIDNSDKRIAQAVIDASNRKDVKILSLNSMQSQTKKQIEDGESYIGVMSENLGVIREALN